MPIHSFRTSVSTVSLLALTVVAGCEQEEPLWPEEQMDARSFPKESASYDVVICGDEDRFIGDGTLSECPMGPQELTCEDLGLIGGEIPCIAECGFALSACTGQACGNGLLEEGEACEFDEIVGCVAADPALGCSICDSSCNIVDEAICGNGIAEYPGEQCDGDDYFYLVPNLLVPPLDAYYYGVVRCTDDCRVDLSEAGPTTCGNGVLERSETCELDGTNTAVQYDEEGNRYVCNGCRLSPVPGSCGDGLLQHAAEGCDGDDFGGSVTLCQELGLANVPPLATIICNSDCAIDYTPCLVPHDEHDDVVEDADTTGNTDAGLAPDAGSAAQPVEDENGCTVSARRSVGANSLWSIAALLGLVFVNRRSGKLRHAAATR